MRKRHHAYLFGRRSQFGWWYYYPVVLAVKTPLPFLVLLFIGLGVSLREVQPRAGRVLAAAGVLAGNPVRVANQPH